jgi:hypothetical protein
VNLAVDKNPHHSIPYHQEHHLSFTSNHHHHPNSTPHHHPHLNSPNPHHHHHTHPSLSTAEIALLKKHEATGKIAIILEPFINTNQYQYE